MSPLNANTVLIKEGEVPSPTLASIIASHSLSASVGAQLDGFGIAAPCYSRLNEGLAPLHKYNKLKASRPLTVFLQLTDLRKLMVDALSAKGSASPALQRLGDTAEALADCSIFGKTGPFNSTGDSPQPLTSTLGNLCTHATEAIEELKAAGLPDLALQLEQLVGGVRRGLAPFMPQTQASSAPLSTSESTG